MNELPTMTLVLGEDGVHARGSVMTGRRLVIRLRGLAIIAAVWTVVSLFGALALYLRISTGEIKSAPGWFWVGLAPIPVWTAVTPPILALSRRFPLARGTWPRAVLVHAVALVAVLALDGVVSMWASPEAGGRVLTYWQQLWRYTFINAFFYAGVVAVEHAARYYRLYLDRRVRASELEAQVSRAQLQALQMQIRPHFLFNTLNTISGLVRVDDKAAAITMLAGLGDLLRLLLRSDGAQEVPVHQELELIERYLQIEQVRFGDKLAIELRVEPGVEDALVPNLILQPLVENAVRHGIGSATGRVSVVVERLGETLRMAVSDTGDAQPRDGDSHGIGLTNTRARLERLYGSVHRFELAQGPAGTSAIIEIPLHHEPSVPV
jgi:two-component sensor histidine kinase